MLTADVESCNECKVVACCRKDVTCLCVSIDGLLLVSGSADGSVCIWKMSDRSLQRSISHRGSITNMLLSHIRPSCEPLNPKLLTPLQVLTAAAHSDLLLRLSAHCSAEAVVLIAMAAS